MSESSWGVHRLLKQRIEVALLYGNIHLRELTRIWILIETYRKQAGEIINRALAKPEPVNTPNSR